MNLRTADFTTTTEMLVACMTRHHLLPAMPAVLVEVVLLVSTTYWPCRALIAQPTVIDCSGYHFLARLISHLKIAMNGVRSKLSVTISLTEAKGQDLCALVAGSLTQPRPMRHTISMTCRSFPRKHSGWSSQRCVSGRALYALNDEKGPPGVRSVCIPRT